MRKHKAVSVLAAEASLIALSIVVYRYEDGFKETERRHTSQIEYDTIYPLAYSALLILNREQNRKSNVAHESVIQTVAITLQQIIPECDTIDTLSVPLRRIIDTWEDEE